MNNNIHITIDYTINYDINGIKYFIYLCSKIIDNDKYYMMLPFDIKYYIWNLYHIKPLLSCSICKKILIPIEVDIREEIITENFVQLNKIAVCNEC